MITVREQLECLEREIARRKRAYPIMVEAGKMSKGRAEKEIKTMEAVKVTLLVLPSETCALEFKAV